MSAYGPGLTHGRIGEQAEFVLVTKDAGTGAFPYLLTSGYFFIFRADL